jgi:rRNA-processing protein FCF1
VHLVVEGAAARADLPEHPNLVIVRAPADGDATIAQLAAELGENVQVVTADRELRERVHAAGATTIGPHSFLRMMR